MKKSMSLFFMLSSFLLLSLFPNLVHGEALLFPDSQPESPLNNINRTEFSKGEPSAAQALSEGSSQISVDLNVGLNNNGLGLGGQMAYRYFFAPRSAIGGLFSYQKDEFEKRFSVGPSFRYYFIQESRWAFHFTHSLLYSYGERGNSFGTLISHSLRSQTSVGLEYFLKDHLSLGVSSGVNTPIFNGSNGTDWVSRVGLNFYF